MRRVLLGLALVAVLGAAHAYVQYTTADGLALSWDVARLELLVAPATPLGIEPSMAALDQAIGAWMATDCDAPPLTARVSDAATLSPDDQQPSVVWVADPAVWNERFSSLELARTILIHRVISGRIVDADIAVNVGGFSFSTGACDAERYDLQGALTHELGHLFGLDHSLDPDATMKAKEVAGDCEMRTLAPDDVAGLCATYQRPEPPEAEAEAEPEAVPEASPEPVEVVEGADGDVVERADRGGRDDGCSGADRGAVMAVFLLAAVRRARRANARCRR